MLRVAPDAGADGEWDLRREEVLAADVDFGGVGGDVSVVDPRTVALIETKLSTRFEYFTRTASALIVRTGIGRNERQRRRKRPRQPERQPLLRQHHPELRLGRQASLRSLPTDRPNTFKLSGAYDFKWGTILGANWFLESGVPQTTVVRFTGYPVFVYGRGDLGRTPAQSQLDLNAMQEFKLPGHSRIQLGGEHRQRVRPGHLHRVLAGEQLRPNAVHLERPVATGTSTSLSRRPCSISRAVTTCRRSWPTTSPAAAT